MLSLPHGNSVLSKAPADTPRKWLTAFASTSPGVKGVPHASTPGKARNDMAVGPNPEPQT